MTQNISLLNPAEVWTAFEEICKVPRPSKKEEKIIAFLENFAKNHKLTFKNDEAGNVLISKKATPGFEKRPGVILQSHLDMVGEKNSNVVHNFESDPIIPYIDGDWVKAKGTTLGADCGIGIAAQMAVLASDSIEHGPLECLFTVDEETGLTGAFALKPNFMSGDILLNLDSEDEGELFIGCAGGIDTIAHYKPKIEEVPKGFFPIEIKIWGLLGGHSGDDIDRGRESAVKIMSRFLFDAYHNYGIRIHHIDAGNLRNAIAREARVVLLIQHGYKENLVADFNIFKNEISNENKNNEPGLRLDLSSTDMPSTVIDDKTCSQLINALFVCPHGVQAMSNSMAGMVETSTNLASVKFTDSEIIEITTSQRSETDSKKNYIAKQVEAVFELNGASVRHSDGYPGWQPNPESKVVKKSVEVYQHLFTQAPVVRSIHAGLECGLFLAKYPNLDMVSFGPTIKGAHSPDERLNIKTVDKFWEFLKALLKVL